MQSSPVSWWRIAIFCCKFSFVTEWSNIIDLVVCVILWMNIILIGLCYRSLNNLLQFVHCYCLYMRITAWPYEFFLNDKPLLRSKGHNTLLCLCGMLCEPEVVKLLRIQNLAAFSWRSNSHSSTCLYITLWLINQESNHAELSRFAGLRENIPCCTFFCWRSSDNQTRKFPVVNMQWLGKNWAHKSALRTFPTHGFIVIV